MTSALLDCRECSSYLHTAARQEERREMTEQERRAAVGAYRQPSCALYLGGASSGHQVAWSSGL